jgi:hypothetical protein
MLAVNNRELNMSIEEWWGRTFEGRGKYAITTMPGKSVKATQQMATEDVAELYRSEGVHDHPSVGGILAGVELRRRENWTGRAALRWSSQSSHYLFQLFSAKI